MIQECEVDEKLLFWGKFAGNWKIFVVLLSFK